MTLKKQILSFQGEVVGISGFYVVPQFLGLANQAAGALRIENLQPHASRYLSLPFEKVRVCLCDVA